MKFSIIGYMKNFVLKHIPFVISLHFYLVICISLLFYVASAYIYILYSDRLEPYKLYFYNTSRLAKNQPVYLPELRNIPIPNNELSIKSSNSKLNLEYFVSELLLGPQNIYAQQVASKYVEYSHISINKRENILYVSLNFKDELKNYPNYEEIQRIKDLLVFNINKYYSFSDIILIVGKKLFL